MKITRGFLPDWRTLLTAMLIAVSSSQATTTFPDILSVGPFPYPSPTYFYVNTKIPLSSGVTPQIQLKGYMYGASNKAMDVTLSWYVYNNVFYWTQYHSKLGFAKPSRIRLGTYDDAGTTRIRLEIANDGVYWASYFLSATDILGYPDYYSGWTYAEGAMPAGTGLITEVPLQGDVQIFGNLTAANFSNGAIFGSASGLALNAGGTNQNVVLTPSGNGSTLLNGNVGIGTTTPQYKISLGSPSDRIGWYSDPAHYNSIEFYNSSTGGMTFDLNTASGGGYEWKFAGAPLVAFQSSGNVGIGTTTPTHKLSVNGTIRAKEVIVDTGWADYVFEDDYRLAPLSEVEAHIRAKKHLPGIPSAAEVAEHGVSMGDMQSKLLSKVEELTLHLIRMEKENSALRQRVRNLESNSAAP